jgi:hypothetical protein
MSITIRGKEYAIAHVTDAIARAISEHVDTSLPLLTRHQNTWAALKTAIPSLPDEMFNGKLLTINDVEVVPILQAIANALAEDNNFKAALDSVKDLPGMSDTIAQMAVYDPNEISPHPSFAQLAVFDSGKTQLAESAPEMQDSVEVSGLTPEELKLIMAVRSAKK